MLVVSDQDRGLSLFRVLLLCVCLQTKAISDGSGR